MKIALVLERFDPQGGGLEQWAWALAHTLARRGYSVTVLAFKVANTDASSRVMIRVLPWYAKRSARARVADQALAELKVDLVHDLGVGCSSDLIQPQGGCRLANYYKEHRSLSQRERIIASLDPRHLVWLNELKRFEKHVYAQSGTNLVVAVSQKVAADLNYWYGLTSERIQVIPNGVDISRFSALEPSLRNESRRHFKLEGKVVFLFAAHNPRLKGIRPLLSAFARARIQNQDLALITIGNTPDRTTLQLVRDLNLKQSVQFFGNVKDTLPYFAASDAFVLPTWYDACSLSILEACACGLPVITTRDNGLSELLNDGWEGRVLDESGNIAALAEALLELSNLETRARMGRHAIRFAEHHSFTKNIDAIESLYRKIYAKKLYPETHQNRESS